MIPIVCAVIVLTVIFFVAFFVFCKRRAVAGGPLADRHNQQNLNGFMTPHLSNDRYMSSDGFQLAILDPRKEILNECCSSDVSELQTKDIYMSSAYGMPIQQERNERMQLYSTVNKQQHATCCKESELSLSGNLKRKNFNEDQQHLYDMPTKPKWVWATLERIFDFVIDNNDVESGNARSLSAPNNSPLPVIAAFASETIHFLVVIDSHKLRLISISFVYIYFRRLCLMTFSIIV